MSSRFPWMLALAGLLGGCGPFSTLDPGGTQARWLANLGWGLIVLMCLVTLVMVVLIIVGARRHRGSLQEHLPLDTGGGSRWILYGGVVVPVTVLTILFVITIVSMRVFPSDAEDDPDIEIEVTAHQWWWEIDYPASELGSAFSTANEMVVPVGARVKVKLASADVIHSFWVPRLHGKMDAIPGHENSLVFEATEAGRYGGKCAEYCGVQHAHMPFTVIAKPPEGYRRWARQQREPAVTPTDPQLVKGREAFETYSCAMCHRIRGTDAHGGVAPDLTHFGSRRTIAGVMPNTRARLQAWIVDAQGFKPGSKMPTLEQFDGETLNALAAYLESLE